MLRPSELNNTKKQNHPSSFSFARPFFCLASPALPWILPAHAGGLSEKETTKTNKQVSSVRQNEKHIRVKKEILASGRKTKRGILIMRQQKRA